MMQPGQRATPVLVLNSNTKRESGRKAQIANITAAKAVADMISSTLGPRSMLKMLLDPMGGIVMTNDGNAILREIDVTHPAAKSMIELSRAQDEEVGDGTTSVIILAGEMMSVAKPFFEREVHPSIVVGAYYKAMEEGLKIINEIAETIDVKNDEEIKKALRSCVGTKFSSRWGNLVVDLALKAVRTVMMGNQQALLGGKLSIDIKRYAKVEKIPGGLLEECVVLDGVMVNKDIVHPKMRRTIKNPRILLLDCNLEYKKGESQTNMEMSKDSDMTDALQQEINEIATMCSFIMKHNPDVIVTEKGVSDLAQHFLLKQNISVLRRVRKTDNNRIARISGATIVNRPEEIQEKDIGTDCGLFDIKKIGDDYFTFFIESKTPKACTILLRGASKDVLNEMERNLADCLAVARNIFINPKLVPGGGAIELEVAQRLQDKAKTVEGLQQLPMRAVAFALEIIPRTLAQNCGADVVRIITELRAKHAGPDGKFFGIDGNTGKVADMRVSNVWEPVAVKLQTFKTAIESSCMLLRIDDVVSGIKKRREKAPGKTEQEQGPEGETFGDQRDG
jgi:T-complex protein 1 subunit gamma